MNDVNRMERLRERVRFIQLIFRLVFVLGWKVFAFNASWNVFFHGCILLLTTVEWDFNRILKDSKAIRGNVRWCAVHLFFLIVYVLAIFTI